MALAYDTGGGMAFIPSGSSGKHSASVPPIGTSAYKAYQYTQRTGSNSTTDGLNNIKAILSGGTPEYKQTGALETLKDYNPTKPSSPSGSSGSSGSSGGGTSAQQLSYLNADLAQAYGMSKETAYSEALSNTAYQRAVKDMKAAGLNPAVLFGAGRGYTADGVNYISSASSGGGGGSGGYSRRSGGSSGNGYLFSEGAYGAISAAAGLVGMVVTKGNPSGYWVGSQTAKGVMGALNSISKLF